MSYSVALVGAGPTALYCLQALLGGVIRPAAITIFERQRRAGQGTPYSPHWSDPIMLANIASIEIPSLPERLVDWLASQTDARLAAFGVHREDINDRAFYPRLVLGEYLSAQFAALVDRGRAMGIDVEVRTQSTVIDVSISHQTLMLTVLDSRKCKTNPIFDYVILATGHQWPADPEIRPGYFTSPWPASALARIRNCAVGIRGTSLSAIDASVALASHHGEFVESESHGLNYRAHPDTEDFSMCLFSRKGLLPEADFYHPIPYEPLSICNAEAIEGLIARYPAEGLLDAAFQLFREELVRADPDYSADLNLQAQTLEGFCDAYFEKRTRADPFKWARRDLEEAVSNAQRKVTVKWRYAILRMHEVFAQVAPHLSDLDYTRFTESLKGVFVDNYATVPHDSVRRLMALHEAGKLTVRSLDKGARVDTWAAPGGATLWEGTACIHFPVFIEATGQQVASAKEFPFPSLRRQGVVQDVETDDTSDAKRGIAVDGAYHPISAFEPCHRLFCLSLPFLLGQHPFAQGITSSAEMADVVAKSIDATERIIPPPGAGARLSVARSDIGEQSAVS